jgi:plastocyanin
MQFRAIISASLLLLAFGTASAVDNHYELTIANHRFEPAELTVPAGVKVKLTVHNKDNNFEEFHSDDLHREKIVGPNKSGVINIGPLNPGTYSFMGEFHADTAQGRIIVK